MLGTHQQPQAEEMWFGQDNGKTRPDSPMASTEAIEIASAPGPLNAQIVVKRKKGEKLGLRLKSTKYGIAFTAVTAEGPGDRAGICEGDFLVAVKDTEVAGLRHSDVVTLMQENTGDIPIVIAKPAILPISIPDFEALHRKEQIQDTEQSGIVGPTIDMEEIQISNSPGRSIMLDSPDTKVSKKQERPRETRTSKLRTLPKTSPSPKKKVGKGPPKNSTRRSEFNKKLSPPETHQKQKEKVQSCEISISEDTATKSNTPQTKINTQELEQAPNQDNLSDFPYNILSADEHSDLELQVFLNIEERVKSRTKKRRNKDERMDARSSTSTGSHTEPKPKEKSSKQVIDIKTSPTRSVIPKSPKLYEPKSSQAIDVGNSITIDNKKLSPKTASIEGKTSEKSSKQEINSKSSPSRSMGSKNETTSKNSNKQTLGQETDNNKSEPEIVQYLDYDTCLPKNLESKLENPTPNSDMTTSPRIDDTEHALPLTILKQNHSHSAFSPIANGAPNRLNEPLGELRANDPVDVSALRQSKRKMTGAPRFADLHEMSAENYRRYCESLVIGKATSETGVSDTHETGMQESTNGKRQILSLFCQPLARLRAWFVTNSLIEEPSSPTPNEAESLNCSKTSSIPISTKSAPQLNQNPFAHPNEEGGFKMFKYQVLLTQLESSKKKRLEQMDHYNVAKDERDRLLSVLFGELPEDTGFKPVSQGNSLEAPQVILRNSSIPQASTSNLPSSGNQVATGDVLCKAVMVQLGQVDTDRQNAWENCQRALCQRDLALVAYYGVELQFVRIINMPGDIGLKLSLDNTVGSALRLDGFSSEERAAALSQLGLNAGNYMVQINGEFSMGLGVAEAQQLLRLRKNNVLTLTLMSEVDLKTAKSLRWNRFDLATNTWTLRNDDSQNDSQNDFDDWLCDQLMKTPTNLSIATNRPPLCNGNIDTAFPHGVSIDSMPRRGPQEIYNSTSSLLSEKKGHPIERLLRRVVETTPETLEAVLDDAASKEPDTLWRMLTQMSGSQQENVDEVISDLFSVLYKSSQKYTWQQGPNISEKIEQRRSELLQLPLDRDQNLMDEWASLVSARSLLTDMRAFHEAAGKSTQMQQAKQKTHEGGWFSGNKISSWLSKFTPRKKNDRHDEIVDDAQWPELESSVGSERAPSVDPDAWMHVPPEPVGVPTRHLLEQRARERAKAEIARRKAELEFGTSLV
eukprot:m.125365 g.125365  ORF g.125365 m.125365 type:complete len:1201 (+) comp14491_c0_seq3:295-3897(+)